MRQPTFCPVTWKTGPETCSHLQKRLCGHHIHISPGFIVSVFRGTTNKLVGWKEDLNNDSSAASDQK
ncbi:Mbeg1-like protein [Lacticaseibacillus paracasei]